MSGLSQGRTDSSSRGVRRCTDLQELRARNDDENKGLISRSAYNVSGSALSIAHELTHVILTALQST